MISAGLRMTMTGGRRFPCPFPSRPHDRPAPHIAMTRRATFTEAELRRAIKAAEQLGKGVAIRHGAILIVDAPEATPLPLPESEGNTCDGKFGKAP